MPHLARLFRLLVVAACLAGVLGGVQGASATIAAMGVHQPAAAGDDGCCGNQAADTVCAQFCMQPAVVLAGGVTGPAAPRHRHAIMPVSAGSGRPGSPEPDPPRPFILH